MQNQHFEIAGIEVGPGKREFVRIPVTTLLVGAELTIPLHIVNGAQKGPVLGLISGLHGDEPIPIRMIRKVLMDVDPEALAGTILAIPVANPVAFARSKRSTPEEDIDYANLNRIFPGTRPTPAFGYGTTESSDRTLTEWMAAAISEVVLPHIQYMLDFHCNGPLGGLMEMLATEMEDSKELNKESLELAKLFNVGFIHGAPPLRGTAGTYAESLGAVIACPEIGGGHLSGAAQKKAVEMGVKGVINVMKYLEMIPGAPDKPVRHFVGTILPHIRPSKAGYLVSEFEAEDLVEAAPAGIRVSAGQLLGIVFDAYSLEEAERLEAPVDGILYMVRTSGPVEAGNHAFAVAAYEGGYWLE